MKKQIIIFGLISLMLIVGVFALIEGQVITQQVIDNQELTLSSLNPAHISNEWILRNDIWILKSTIEYYTVVKEYTECAPDIGCEPEHTGNYIVTYKTEDYLSRYTAWKKSIDDVGIEETRALFDNWLRKKAINDLNIQLDIIKNYQTKVKDNLELENYLITVN